jgi:hypothetical protein
MLLARRFSIQIFLPPTSCKLEKQDYVALIRDAGITQFIEKTVEPFSP